MALYAPLLGHFQAEAGRLSAVVIPSPAAGRVPGVFLTCPQFLSSRADDANTGLAHYHPRPLERLGSFRSHRRFVLVVMRS